MPTTATTKLSKNFQTLCQASTSALMDRSRIPALSSCPRLRAQLAQESGLYPSTSSAEQPNVATGVFVVNAANYVCQKKFRTRAGCTPGRRHQAERTANSIPWSQRRKPPTDSFPPSSAWHHPAERVFATRHTLATRPTANPQATGASTRTNQHIIGTAGGRSTAESV